MTAQPHIERRAEVTREQQDAALTLAVLGIKRVKAEYTVQNARAMLKAKLETIPEYAEAAEAAKELSASTKETRTEIRELRKAALGKVEGSAEKRELDRARQDLKRITRRIKDEFAEAGQALMPFMATVE